MQMQKEEKQLILRQIVEKNKVREPLDFGENTLVLAGRLKKKDFYIKVRLKINHFSMKIKQLL